MAALESNIPLDQVGRFLPTTRYRGSKRKHASLIAEKILELQPTELHDPMGGSGSICALADQLGVPTHYNDLYQWAAACARALLVHRFTPTDMNKAKEEVQAHIAAAEPGFITETFADCYFTEAENIELDGVLECLEHAVPRRVRDLIFYGAAQAALAKMPMSMFHRASIGQRLANVERRCGNATTWNTPFALLIPRHIEEAVSFTWRRKAHHKVTCHDATRTPRRLKEGGATFIDPPYINPRGGVPTYGQAYHFLEGLIAGRHVWERGIDPSGRHAKYIEAAQSELDTAAGWVNGVSRLLDSASAGSVLATGRHRDSPGATKLRNMLLERYENVSSCRLQSSTIFTSNKNPEFLFSAV